MKKINIAIDGHSSCGKSTLAKDLAKEFNYKYVDSGAMYRAVALYAIRHDLLQHPDKLIDQLPFIDISFVYADGCSQTFLNGENVEETIRKMEVAEKVSTIAKIPEVRKKLVAVQQKIGSQGGVVMDGRDIGTIVFPDAELKIFMTAAPEVRAQRRQAELNHKGQKVSLDIVIQNLLKRDDTDTQRETDPLRQAEGAKVLDNSNLDRAEQLSLAIGWATEAINKR